MSITVLNSHRTESPKQIIMVIFFTLSEKSTAQNNQNKFEFVNTNDS